MLHFAMVFTFVFSLSRPLSASSWFGLFSFQYTAQIDKKASPNTWALVISNKFLLFYSGILSFFLLLRLYIFNQE